MPDVSQNPSQGRFSALVFVIAILAVTVIGLLIYIVSQSKPSTPPSSTNQTGISTLSGIQPLQVPAGTDKNTLIDDPNSPFVGSSASQAKVTVVEFLDFQCPYCQEAAPNVPTLLNKYRDKPVRFVFRNLPIESLHPYAVPAAHAAMCAAAQGLYMSMYSALYSKQSQITPDAVYDIARDAGVEMNAFSTCMSKGTYRNQIQKDLSDAVALGAEGTPTWFINGQKFEGALSVDTMSTIIDQLLGTSSASTN